MQRRRTLKWISLCAIGAAAAGIYILYRLDIGAVEDRVAAGSEIVDTAHGPVEYATWGSGPPAMIIHGAGGGYDQGRLMVEAYAGDGFRWIAPSRFGYLRSPMPDDVSTAAQADVFAGLLDALGIARIAVVAVSGGVPPTIKLAERYPQRVSALVLISSAPYTPFAPEEHHLPVPAWVYQLLFSSNFPYWLMQKIARPSLEGLYDVNPARKAGLTAEELATIGAMVDTFQPVVQRSAGVANEAAAIDADASYQPETIAVPTLVIHARDDGIAPFAGGARTAERIFGAELMAFDTGGHLLLGHHAAVRARVNAFLRERKVD